MDTRYWNKSTLYEYVDGLRKAICGTSNVFPINSKELAARCIRNLLLEEIVFSNTDICGILYKRDHSASIALNARRSVEIQNFDCAHELIHYFFHDIDYGPRICSDRDGNSISQDAYIEWQANEGAAQLLMPYQDFIPRFLSMISPSLSVTNFHAVEDLARYYFVSSAVIGVRIKLLSYEIDQYRNGCPVNQIQLLSKRQLEKRSIRVTPYLAILDFGLDLYLSSAM